MNLIANKVRLGMISDMGAPKTVAVLALTRVVDSISVDSVGIVRCANLMDSIEIANSLENK